MIIICEFCLHSGVCEEAIALAGRTAQRDRNSVSGKRAKADYLLNEDNRGVQTPPSQTHTARSTYSI